MMLTKIATWFLGVRKWFLNIAVGAAVLGILVRALIAKGERQAELEQRAKDVQAKFNARDAVADSHAGGGSWHDRLREHRDD